MRLQGSAPQNNWEAAQLAPGRISYFDGDRSQWRTGITRADRIALRAAYPGIDWIVYGKDSGFEYDFAVAPGADPNLIRLSFPEASASIDSDGNLIVEAAGHRLTHRKPSAYQVIAGHRSEIPSRFVAHPEGGIGFALGAYDPSHELILDPILSFSTYAGTPVEERAVGVALDANGFIYVVWQTVIPVQPYTYAFVMKFTPDGSTLVYGAYIGAQSGVRANGMGVTPAGEVVVGGVAYSGGFPLVSAYDSSFGGFEEGFLMKINAAGDALLYSTFLGGLLKDSVTAVAVDSAGAMYVAGNTESGAFPVHAALQPNGGGGTDAFVGKFPAAGGNPVFLTYLGAQSLDEAASIAVDGAGRIYVAGTTDSIYFPVTGVPGGTAKGEVGSDAFITVYAPNGQSMIYSRFLGGFYGDSAGSIAVQSNGTATVLGGTSSQDFPVTGGLSYTPPNGFLARLSPTGALLYSSIIFAGARQIKVNEAGETFLVGRAYAGNPIPIVAAYQTNSLGGDDGFFTKLSAAGNTILMSTYLSGSNNDEAVSLALDGAGNAIILGTTESSNFPLLNPYDSSLDGTSDVFLLKLETVQPTVRHTVTSVPTGLLIHVDGTSYTTPANFDWVPGTPHDLIPHTPQGLGSILYTFNSWSQGGAASQTVTASATPSTYTANFSGAACTYTVSPLSHTDIPQVGGEVTSTLTTQPGCSWSHSGNVPWLNSFTGQCCVGNGFVTYLVPANNTGASRTGSFTLGGRTVTVQQSGTPCNYGMQPPELRFGGTGGVGTLTITAAPGCPWQVVGSPIGGFITPTTGSGNGSVQYSMGKNSLSINRVGSAELRYTGGSITHMVFQGPIPTKAAAYFDGYWVADLNANFIWDGPSTDRVVRFTLGPGETPLVGDWSGDGSQKAGVYRDGTWMLDYNGNGVYDGPVTDRLFYLGGPGFTPVVGKWQGSTWTKVAVHKEGLWMIDINGNFAWDGPGTDKLLYFGGPGYQPFVGSFGSGGVDKIAVHMDGLWIVDFNGNFAWDGPAIDKLVFFGGPGYTPVMGDWNGDQYLDVAVYKDGVWLVDFNGNFAWDGIAVDRIVYFGGAGYRPVAGDWNGDGKSKVGGYWDGLWVLDVNGDYAWNGLVTDKLTFFGGPGQTPVPARW